MKKVWLIFVALLMGQHIYCQQLQMHEVAATYTFIPAPKPQIGKVPIGMMPDDYYTRHLGFFCRQELKLQKAKIPVAIRLGSMEQCNRLEQKPGYR